MRWNECQVCAVRNVPLMRGLCCECVSELRLRAADQQRRIDALEDRMQRVFSGIENDPCPAEKCTIGYCVKHGTCGCIYSLLATDDSREDEG